MSIKRILLRTVASLFFIATLIIISWVPTEEDSFTSSDVSCQMKPATSAEAELKELYDLRIQYPVIALTQLFHETDSLKSYHYKTNFNKFGIKCTSQRKYCVENNRDHARFSSYEACNREYLFYQQLRIPVWESYYNRSMDSESAYYHLLEHVVFKSQFTADGHYIRRYATDMKYVEKLKRWRRKLLDDSLVRKEFLECILSNPLELPVLRDVDS